MESKTVYLKCTLLNKKGENKNVSRFVLESAAVNDYSYAILTQKICAAFPKLLNKTFTLFYIGIDVKNSSF